MRCWRDGDESGQSRCRPLSVPPTASASHLVTERNVRHMLIDPLPARVQQMIRSYENELRGLVKEHYSPFDEARAPVSWKNADGRYQDDSKEARAKTERAIRDYLAANPDKDDPDFFSVLVEPCLNQAERKAQAWYQAQVPRVG